MAKFNKTITTLKPTPSSPVSNPHLILHKSDSLQVNPHLILHKSDSLQVTPTNSSQSDNPPSKIPNSCKTNLSTKSLKALTYGKYRSTVCKWKGLVSQYLVNIWEPNYEKLLR